jgi:hypothetical protein
MAPQIEAKYAEMNRQQAADHLAFKTRNASTATQNNITSHLTSQKVDRAGAIADISKQLTDARQNLGVDEYQKYIANIINWFDKSALAASMKPGGKLDRARWVYLFGETQQIFEKITVGPNNDRLVDQLGSKGGVSAQIQLA